MAKFSYHNLQNRRIYHTLFELSYGYYLYISLENKTNSLLKSHMTNELGEKLAELMMISP